MECDAESLAEAAACFVGLSSDQQGAAQIYLICFAINDAPS